MLQLRSFALLFSLSLLLAACGPTMVDDCRTNCAGCCTAEGFCELGVGPIFCGSPGTQCATCLPGQQCQLGPV